MLLFFTRPPEVPGIYAVIFTFVTFVVITVTCAVLFLVFRGSNQEKLKSYLKGFTFVGLILLAFQIILSIPFLIVLSFFYGIVIQPMVGPSSGTFRDFDNFFTYFWLIFSLVCYVLIVKFSHHKFKRKKKELYVEDFK